jgi:phosphate transport system ATP-binding protein
MSSEVLFKVENLNAGFGESHILKDISCYFTKNDVIALIGPSGCGKSTFIRTLNRLHEEVNQAWIRGHVFFNNKDIYQANVDPVLIRRQIGMVFQKPNPFPGLTIFENVGIGLKLAGIKNKSTLSELIEKALLQAALWDEVKDKLHKPGTSLSGGQQQRLCIARALAVEPPVILMDEPTSALDPISTAKIEDLVQELKKTVTVIMVTHNMQQASRISDKTAFFLMGELVEFDDTSRVFTEPQDERTENYITGRFG